MLAGFLPFNTHAQSLAISRVGSIKLAISGKICMLLMATSGSMENPKP